MPKWLLVGLVAVTWLTWHTWQRWPDQRLHLIMCDVGQGDAILITHGFTQVLIDAGRDEQVLDCLRRYLPWGDQTIELAVATHADSDHIGGFPVVFDRYQLRAFMIEPLTKKTDVFAALEQRLSREMKQRMTLLLPQVGQRLTFNDFFQLTTLSPRESQVAGTPPNDPNTETTLWDAIKIEGSEETEYNDRSIVLLLEVASTRVLLTGDLEQAGELALQTAGLLPDVDILKIGHHGAKTSTSMGFLETVRPEIALISAGQNNSYGHPAPEVVGKLEQKGVRVLRTDRAGHLHLVFDGQSWQLY